MINFKRFVWLLLFVVPPILIMAAAWRAHHGSLPSSTVRGDGFVYVPTKTAMCDLLGLAEGISKKEIQDATNRLVQERYMWSRFYGMSGGISVDYEGNDGQQFPLAGTVSIGPVNISTNHDVHLPIKYQMTMLVKPEGWSVTTDGTSEMTETTCNDPKTSQMLKMVAPAIFHMLTFPREALLDLYADELNPQARYTFENVLKTWHPWRVKNEVAQHSYTFFEDYGHFPQFTFKDGHLYRWQEIECPGQPPFFKVLVKVCLSFDQPAESGGFWYPTVIQITPAPTPWPYPAMSDGFLEESRTVLPEIPQKGHLRINLSNVLVDMSRVD